MTNQLKGLHHVTAMTSSAEKNYQFFTNILGMRLIKKTINQDDILTYHTFFGDDLASPGTDMTFFDFPNNPKGVKGTNRISRTSFRVPNDDALNYWLERFENFNIEHQSIEEQFGKKVLKFQDFDQQDYQLISDRNNYGVPAGTPWKKGPVPAEFAIVGLGPVEITINYFPLLKDWFESVLEFTEIATDGQKHLYEVATGGNGAQVVLVEDNTSTTAQQGFGEVHHLAFRVANRAALEQWIQKIQQTEFPSSGYVDRFYFESLYVRVGYILFEFATDGPGFMQDEPYETLGEKLSLPPFLEGQRPQIEATVRPFDTVWSDAK